MASKLRCHHFIYCPMKIKRFEDSTVFNHYKRSEKFFSSSHQFTVVWEHTKMSSISVSILSSLWLFSLISLQEVSSMEYNNTLSLIISSRRNQTGHYVSQASVSKEDSKTSNHWKLKIDQSNFEQRGMHSLKFTVTFVAPPPIPTDYELFPGVGFYKFHSDYAKGFEEASSQCAKEGGHLAIVNSESEHQVLQVMFARHLITELKSDWTFVGFHDQLKEGDFITIFGQPLHSTGFTHWSHPGQPDNTGRIENCGTVHRNGDLNDYPCSGKVPFFCEYDLSWAEN